MAAFVYPAFREETVRAMTKWQDRLRQYRADRVDPALADTVRNAYVIGYAEGEDSAWADVTAYLDKWGDAAFLAWVKRRIGVE